MLIDAHAHLDQYQDSLDLALNQITHNNILTITNSVDPPSYERNLEIARTNPLVLPTFGVHPWKAPDYIDRLQELEEHVEHSPMLGEIGLDYHWVEDPSHYPAQRRVLEFFLGAAREQGKIVNVHTKGAEGEILHLLGEYGIDRVIVHWYSGPLDLLHDLLSYGAYFTLGIELLYSDQIRRIARALPTERILTETDNPGGLEWLTGTTGMPVHIKEVIEELASLRKSTPDSMARSVSSNLERLTRGDRWLTAVHRMLSAGAGKGL